MGADNYDVEYGDGYKLMYKIHSWIRKHTNAKMLLYDCSLNPNSVSTDFIKEIERFDLTTIRESESWDNLQKLYKGNKALFAPDPAFVMEQEVAPLPPLMKNSQCVGINLSDLILRDTYGANKEIVFANYFNLIDNILSTTEMNVILIPHVMKNQDLSVLRHIYKQYTQNDRVFLIENEDLSASQLKFIISKFRFLVTARTHASIAAYSTEVPTLVLGYSIKSKGIAKDLFGRYEDYVIPINSLTKTDVLWEKFKWIMSQETEIQKRLSEVLPQYQNKAMSVGTVIKKLLIRK